MSSNPFDKKEVSTEVIDNTKVGLAIAKAGISGPKAQDLRDMFVPFEMQANEWAEKAKSIVVTDSSQVDAIEKAKNGRLSMQKIRSAIEAKHKEIKADALKEGQLYDLIRRVLLALVEPIETHYKEQEKFVERQQAAKRTELYNARLAMLSGLLPVDQAKALPLSDMTEDAFSNMVLGYKTAAEQRARQEKEDAERRQEEDRKREEENQRIREENRKLKAEQDAQRQKDVTASMRASLLIGCGATMEEGDSTILYTLQAEGFPRIYTNLADLRRMPKEEWEELLKSAQTMQDSVLAAKEETRKKEAAEKAKLDEKLKKEREERQRLERAAREKQERDEAEAKAKAAADRKVKRSPDRVKLLSFAEQISLLEPPKLKDDEAQQILNDVTGMLARVVKFINDKVEKNL